MAGIKISEYDDAAALTGSELIEMVQGGVNVKFTPTQMRTYVLTDITTAMFAVNVVDTDITLAANSDTRLATQKAMKGYVDALVLSAGSGDVVGPASAVNNNFAAFDGTTGKLIKDSGKAIPSGNVASDTVTTECIAGYIATVANKTYKIVVKIPHGATITEATTISESGTCTATFKINTTALGGTANSVSTTETSQSHASANVASAGDDIQLTVSSNSTCLGLSFSLKYTRTLS
jgi:hypothetical protein